MDNFDQEPPKEIRDAAILVSNYFNSGSSELHDWEFLNLCSRTFAYKYRDVVNRIAGDNMSFNVCY